MFHPAEGSTKILRTVRFLRQAALPPTAHARTLRNMNLPRPSTLLLATMILWTVAYAAWTAGWMLDPMPYALERALRRVPLCVVGVVLCLGIGRMLAGMRGASIRRLVVAVVLAVMVATIAYAFVNELVFYVIVPRWGDPAWMHIPDVMMTDFWVFAAWVLLYFALSADAARRDREVRLAQTTATAIDAQHKLLLQQINPHFLFNALNTIYALVLEGDNAGAQRGVLALSAFLRRAIGGNQPTRVRLADELESVRHYLDIELVRFGDRLRFQVAIPDALLEREVPYLILQPLVENCVKHGLACSTWEVTIRLSATADDKGWVLTVEDDGFGVDGDDVLTHGVGLDNVAQRLKLLYGKNARLEARARAGGGFIARLHLPGTGP